LIHFFSFEKPTKMRRATFCFNYGRFKKIIDAVAALVAILLIFPWLFPIIALLIKLDSRGPVLFRQQRVGFLGKTFYCYKFRTMRKNDKADLCRAGKEDLRITRFGRFLRNTCLDEIPQFINVLLGQMSIVGPRPHMLTDTREFSRLIGNYNFRHNIRPGITGLAQSKGCRGPASNVETIIRRYQWDAYYVRNVNFRLDCRIMLRTGALMLQSVLHRDKPVLTDSSPSFISHPAQMVGHLVSQ
jgi:putative colanic acid biosynthesis UDP-glucose lipid carrier transferase